MREKVKGGGTMAKKDATFGPVPGTHSRGDTQAKVTSYQGKIRLRIGQKHEHDVLHGSRGRTRIVDLDPEAAAQLVAQLGAAIAKTLMRTVK
jgi:hypothetical protein